MITSLGGVESASELAFKVAQAREKAIVRQLNNLITEGILVIESTQPTLIRQPDNTGEAHVSLEQEVTLKSKHDEVITRLREENRDLKARLNRIKERLDRCLAEDS